MNEALKGYAAILKKWFQLVHIQVYHLVQTKQMTKHKCVQVNLVQLPQKSIVNYLSSTVSYRNYPLKHWNKQRNNPTEFQNYLEKLIRKKQYQLHPEVEKTLAAFSSTFDAPYGLYNTTKMVDMSFDNFEVDGKSIQ